MSTLERTATGFGLVILDEAAQLHESSPIHSGMAMKIGAWLNSLGLGQYEAAFRENAIDADLLPKNSAEDLKEIGVSALGQRIQDAYVLRVAADLDARRKACRGIGRERATSRNRGPARLLGDFGA